MITLLTTKQEVSKKYPHIGKAFQLIDGDSGCSFGENDYTFTKLVDTYNLPQIEEELEFLDWMIDPLEPSENCLNTFCTGEVERQLELVELSGAELSHEFLNCYFNQL